MAGIVTTSSNTGAVRTYRAVFTSTSTSLAINWISGTTSAAGLPRNALDVGVAVTFQNLSTAADVFIGGLDVSTTFGVAIGAKTATNPGFYTIYPSGTFSTIQLHEYYVCTTSSLGVVVAQLIRGV